jgi:tetratricopeptide (TPR) repeat protein
MQQEISLRKKIIFIFITFLVPFVIVGLLELFLRVFDYGQDISLFTKTKIHNKEYHVLNPLIGARYFSTGNIIPIQSTDYFLVPKPKGTFRIFCLGGSTAAGYPYWYNASFASFLRYRLQKIFPEKKIEIINLGMTAINSFIVLDIAREVVDYEPDLIIVYDGHNEFYGPLGVSSQSTIIGSRWLNLLYLKLLHSKVFLLIRDGFNIILNIFSKESGDSREITMELLAKGQYIPYRSDLYEKVKQSFKDNLNDLQYLCKDKHIPVILSTQVSNLRDLVPFVSNERSDLNGELKTALKKHLEAGDLAGADGKLDVAQKELEAVISIDSQYASAHYGIARCYDLNNLFNKAKQEYAKARDFDQLRFRSSSDFNEIILGMKGTPGVNVVDMEKLFAAQSPDSIIGNKLILEHLHPNSYGQFLMAKGYAEVMKEIGLLATFNEWNIRDMINDNLLWNERNVTQLDELIAGRRTEYITSVWPFVQKEKPVSRINKSDTLQIIAENVVEQKSGWGNAHLAVIEYYKKRNDYSNLEKEYRLMISLIPFEVKPYLDLGGFYFERRKFKEAYETFINSLRIQPTKSAFQALGKIEEQIGNIEEANNYYKRAKNLK